MGNLGIPIFTMSQLDVIEQNQLKSILNKKIQRPKEKEFKPMKVMLPIVKMGIAAQFADEKDQLYGANSLTGENITKVWENGNVQTKQPKQEHKIDKNEFTRVKKRRASHKVLDLNVLMFGGREFNADDEKKDQMLSEQIEKEMNHIANILAYNENYQ